MNFALTTTAATQATTMSSREIAELCDKRHDHVMTDIKKMLHDIGLYAPEFSGTYTTAQGNTYECFNLPRDLTVTLITGYRTELRYKVVKRLEELEEQAKASKPATPNFGDPVAAALAWIETYQAKQIAEQKVKELQPLATVGERAVSHKHSLNRIVSALAGVNTMTIKADLQALGYFYRRNNGPYRVYARYSHLFAERVNDTYGTFDIFPTGEGRACVIELYNAGRLTMKKGCTPVPCSQDHDLFADH